MPLEELYKEVCGNVPSEWDESFDVEVVEKPEPHVSVKVKCNFDRIGNGILSNIYEKSKSCFNNKFWVKIDSVSGGVRRIRFGIGKENTLIRVPEKRDRGFVSEGRNDVSLDSSMVIKGSSVEIERLLKQDKEAAEALKDIADLFPEKTGRYLFYRDGAGVDIYAASDGRYLKFTFYKTEYSLVDIYFENFKNCISEWEDHKYESASKMNIKDHGGYSCLTYQLFLKDEVKILLKKMEFRKIVQEKNIKSYKKFEKIIASARNSRIPFMVDSCVLAVPGTMNKSCQTQSKMQSNMVQAGGSGLFREDKCEETTRVDVRDKTFQVGKTSYVIESEKILAISKLREVERKGRLEVMRVKKEQREIAERKLERQKYQIQKKVEKRVEDQVRRYKDNIKKEKTREKESYEREKKSLNFWIDSHEKERKKVEKRDMKEKTIVMMRMYKNKIQNEKAVEMGEFRKKLEEESAQNNKECCVIL